MQYIFATAKPADSRFLGFLAQTFVCARLPKNPAFEEG
jgi:hypothetical protein